MNTKDLDQLKLIYVADGSAYFVKDFEGVCGDNWDDAPYEHKESTPYNYDIILMYRGNWETPEEINRGKNTRYSVNAINRGDIAWLTPSLYCSNEDSKPIRGGDSVSKFIEVITSGGGEVFIPFAKLSEFSLLKLGLKPV